MMNLQTATARELVAYYNAHSGRPPVKKFTDRATAERRCAELAAKHPVIDPVDTPLTALILAEAEASVFGYAEHGHINCPGCGAHLSNGVGEHGDEVNGTRVKHERFKYECLACGQEFGPEIQKPANRAPARKMGPRPVMAESLKLDRRIVHLPSGKVYANACQVWKAGLVSASQGDRLSAELYRAAKRKEYLVLTVNGQQFVMACRHAEGGQV